MRAVARRVLGNDDDAADCVHDVVVRLLARPPAFATERGSLRSYLGVVVRNEAISRLRRSRRGLELERRAVADLPAAYELDVPDGVDVARLRAAIAALPDEQRHAIDLAYRGGLSHAAIAERLHVPLGTVKSRVMLAMRKLGAAVR